MYIVDLMNFSIKRDNVKQHFSIEDYNHNYELFVIDFIEYLIVGFIHSFSITIYNKYKISKFQISLNEYKATGF